MTEGWGGKITAEHLRRKAYIYVRQSTVRQVFENTERARRANMPWASGRWCWAGRQSRWWSSTAIWASQELKREIAKGFSGW